MSPRRPIVGRDRLLREPPGSRPLLAANSIERQKACLGALPLGSGSRRRMVPFIRSNSGMYREIAIRFDLGKCFVDQRKCFIDLTDLGKSPSQRAVEFGRIQFVGRSREALE